jgi:hypothetical protein
MYVVCTYDWSNHWDENRSGGDVAAEFWMGFAFLRSAQNQTCQKSSQKAGHCNEDEFRKEVDQRKLGSNVVREAAPFDSYFLIF